MFSRDLLQLYIDKPNHALNGISINEFQNLCAQAMAWLDLKAENERLKDQLDNVASIGRRMGYALKGTGKHDKLVSQCVDLFKRYGLGGSVMRADAAVDAARAEKDA